MIEIVGVLVIIAIVPVLAGRSIYRTLAGKEQGPCCAGCTSGRCEDRQEATDKVIIASLNTTGTGIASALTAPCLSAATRDGQPGVKGDQTDPDHRGGRNLSVFESSGRLFDSLIQFET